MLSPTASLRELFWLAGPILVSMLSRSLTSAADVFFVAQLGTPSLAGVGLATTFCMLPLVAAIGLSGGFNVLTAQRTGAGRSTDALWWQAVWVGLALGIGAAALAPWAQLGLRAMGASPEAALLGAEYAWWRLLFAPIETLHFTLGATFRGRGDTQTPMRAALVTNLSNLVLDPLFLFGLDLGVAGAAQATVVANLLGLPFYLRGVPRMVGWNHGLILDAWRLGWPQGVQYALDVGAWALFTTLLATLGEAQVAAHILVVRIISLSFLPGYALAEAVQVQVGQALGAQRPRRAHQAWVTGTWAATTLMALCGTAFLVAPGAWLALFGAVPEVAEVGANLLAVAALFQVADAVLMTTFGALRGAGDSRFPLVSSVLCSWLVKLPLGITLALGLGWGATGAWLGLTAEIFVLALLGLGRARGVGWLRRGLRVAAA